MNQNNPKAGSLSLIEAFRAELFRWNRQINLVSRQETEDRLESLFNQCVGGVGAISDVLAPLGKESAPNLIYFDLGSGGGLPGVIWHILFSEMSKPGGKLAGGTVKTWLVEPREKRAWFLNRLNRIPHMPPLAVVRGRWGEGKSPRVDFCDLPGGAFVVVSLKALCLSDIEVLEGLLWSSEGLSGGVRVVIVRYYPPFQAFDESLSKSLCISAQNEAHELGALSFRGLGGGVLPLSEPGQELASLVVSSYEVCKTD